MRIAETAFNQANQYLSQRPIVRTVLTFACLTLGLHFLASFAIELTREQGRIAAVWPVNAVVLAVMIGRSRREWPPIVVSLLVALFTVNVSIGDDVVRAGWLASANALEAILVALLFNFRKTPKLISQLGILKLLIAAAIGCFASTAIAISGLAITGSNVLTHEAIIWFAADTLGFILFTPVIKILTQRTGRFEGFPFNRNQILGFALVCVVAVLVFAQSDYPFLFFVPPALVALAFVSGLRGAAAGLLAVTCISLPFALADRGPTSLMQADMESKILVLQSFLVVNSILALAVGGTVTDRRRLISYLERSKRRLKSRTRDINEMLGKSRLAEEMSGIGHWSLNPKTSVVYWSPQVYEIHGVTPENFDPLYGDAVAFYVPEDRTMVDAAVQKAIEQGQGWELEATLMTPDGKSRRVRSLAECLKDENGEVELIIGVFKDVTEDTRVYEELARSEQQYRILAEHSTDIVLTYNLDGEITFVSPSCRVLGIDPEEAIGQSALQFVIPEDQAEARNAFTQLLKHDPRDGVFRSEHRAPSAGGGFIWLESSPTVIHDEAGKHVSIIASYRDVTDRREREEALAVAREEAEEATRAKAEFLSNMSHEIRTPLNGVLGFTQLFGRTELTEDQKLYLDRIRGAGQMLRDIVNDILDFSKMEAGRLEIEDSPFCIKQLINETVDLVEAGRANGNVPIVRHIDEKADVMLMADDTRLRQILTNLIGNAAKFTSEGQIDVSVSVDGHSVNVTVADTGIGIAKDKLGRVFDGFRQADTTITRKFGGTGLGLTISRSLARMMGGDLWLDSVEGEGTKVSFWIPYKLAPQTPETEDEAAVSSVAGDNLTVMVVDDVEANLSLIELGLRRTGFRILTFTSARDALDALAEGEQPDIILMDVQMPDMDGLTATRAIRKLAGPVSQVPVMALTANALPSQIAECRAAGMDDHLSKPVDLDVLEKKIVQVCGAAANHDKTAEMAEDDLDEFEVLQNEYRDYLATLKLDLTMLMENLNDVSAAKAISALAHSIAGSAGSFGFSDISNAAFDLEEIATAAVASSEDEEIREKLDDKVKAFLQLTQAAA